MKFKKTLFLLDDIDFKMTQTNSNPLTFKYRREFITGLQYILDNLSDIVDPHLGNQTDNNPSNQIVIIATCTNVENVYQSFLQPNLFYKPFSLNHPTVSMKYSILRKLFNLQLFNSNGDNDRTITTTVNDKSCSSPELHNVASRLSVETQA
jgi:hypothetical protein